MKSRLLFAIFAIVAAMSTFTSCDKEDIAVTLENLPAASQTFIAEHFSADNISLITQDKELFDSEYTVLFNDGTTIDFDRNGNWDSIETINGVPESVIPQAIMEYLNSNHAEQKVIDIDKESYGYDLSLDNRLELKFNTEGVLIGTEID